MNLSDLTSLEPGAEGDDALRDVDRFLVAEVGAQRVAVPLLQSREILSVKAVTRLPGAPSFIAGLVNVRGTVLTVVDVGRRLGVDASLGPVVVVEVAERRFGLRVARVDGVWRADAGLEAVDEARSAGGAVRGLVTADGRPTLVLDLEALQRAAIADA